ncbi:unnamed protein product [Adineta steineri]|uniref:acid phosphatase n=1 Tax=Adineta steineri TaxID=433720 RepID=A0A814KSU4_9BILA|nr:unnamed protein product [Adineta steineri]
MKASLLIIFCIFLNQINGQEMELIAGHVLFRHGDRTPIQSYPTDPMKEKDWPNGYGQLTIAGIEQHHRLGQYLRTRYGSILSSNYTASEIVVRSTDYDRTLMSAQSNLIGLYGLKNVSDDTIPIQPVPIHTVPMDKDFLLAVSDCPKFEERGNEVYQTDEFKKMNTYYEPFFQKLEIWTNISNITLYNTWNIPDTIGAHIHNKAPAWADDAVRKNLTDINDFLFYYPYSNDDAKRIYGGPVIQDIWLNMNNSRHGNSYRKFKMYSAHDTTISAALAFLHINYPHQPQYASALFVDLYKQNSSYFVKVEYLNVTDSNKPYPYVLDGCSTAECPFEKFTDIYKPLFPGTFEAECMKMNPTPGGDGNTKKTVIV